MITIKTTHKDPKHPRRIELRPHKPPPLWLLGITWLRTKEDTGVGDTVERALSYMGGDQFKWVMARLGINCGCEDRKQYLNRAYPY